jgi:glycosyltransferase involved in cell wall biosynthesis
LIKKFYSLIETYNDDRIRIIDNVSKGLTNSLNEGIKNSTGQFIARIDADDYCEINRFEKQLEFKNRYNYDIVGSWAYSISHEGKIIGKIELPCYSFGNSQKNDVALPYATSFNTNG